MLSIVYLFFLIVIFLCVLVGFILIWDLRTIKGTPCNSTSSVNLSIIIPARNEAHNLPLLLKSLNFEKKEYPFETIVVDDNSTDHTCEIVRSEEAEVLDKKNSCAIFGK